MGSGNSTPLPDTPYKDLMCISMMYDSIICFYAGRNEINTVRNAILQVYRFGIKNEKEKLIDPKEEDIALPKCYRFKLFSVPFTSGTQEDAIAVKRMATQILYDLYNIGWKLLVSSDLSRTMDVGTWFFRKQANQPCQYPFFSIGISSFNKLSIIDCPENLHAAIREVAATTWSEGIQKESRDIPGVYTLKFNGTPWGLVDQTQSCTARLMIREIMRVLSRHSYLLYGNTNLKSTADTFFFQYMPGLAGQKYATLSLNRMDRIRLIYTDPHIIQAVETTVRNVWQARGGVQEVIDTAPLCYELKLKGHPWRCTGDEGVASRLLICNIMETLACNGYYVISSLDITRIDQDKSLLLFQEGKPMQTTFMCLSLNDMNKVKLIAAPLDVIQAAQKIFALWVGGYTIKPAEELPPGCTYQVNLNGYPWSSMRFAQHAYHGRALMLGLLGAFTDLGWRLVCSADVSAIYVSEKNSSNHHPLDVHSWYFMYDASLLAEGQQLYQPHNGALYSTMPVAGSDPPPPYNAPPPSYQQVMQK